MSPQRSRVWRRAAMGVIAVWVCSAHLLILAGLNARTDSGTDTPASMRWQVRMVEQESPTAITLAGTAGTAPAMVDVVPSHVTYPDRGPVHADSLLEKLATPRQLVSGDSDTDRDDPGQEIPARPVGPWILDEGALSECALGCRLKVDLWVSRDGTITQWALMEAQPEGPWATQTLGPLRATPMHAAQRAGRAVDSRLVVEITVDAQTMSGPSAHHR